MDETTIRNLQRDGIITPAQAEQLRRIQGRKATPKLWQRLLGGLIAGLIVAIMLGLLLALLIWVFSLIIGLL